MGNLGNNRILTFILEKEDRAPKSLLFVLLLLFACCSFKLCADDMSPAEAQVARERFVAESKKYVGCPYVYGAVGPNEFDCSGLIYYVAHESLGMQLPRTAKAMYNYCKIVNANDREIGDLLFFKTNNSGSPITHVGIYIGNGQFISAISDGPNTGVIISSLNQDYWKPRYVATGKFLNSGTAKENSGNSDVGRGGEKSSGKSSGGGTGGRSSLASGRSGTSGASGNGNAFGDSAAFKGSSYYSPDAEPLKSLVADAALFCDWSLISPNEFMVKWRGIDFQTNVRYAKWILEPGFGFALRFNAGLGMFQIPLLFSATVNDYLRFYAGPVISFGNGEMISTGDEIKPSFFPGILGVSFSTPSLQVAKTKVQLVQDVSYTVFNRPDGAALSFVDSLSAGLVFYTGVRVTLGLGDLL